MSINFLVHIISIVIGCVIIYLVGSWGIRKLGAGEPWPTVLALLIVLIVLGAVVAPLLGIGAYWRVAPP